MQLTTFRVLVLGRIPKEIHLNRNELHNLMDTEQITNIITLSHLLLK
jgi:hypothetical protein